MAFLKRRGPRRKNQTKGGAGGFRDVQETTMTLYGLIMKHWGKGGNFGCYLQKRIKWKGGIKEENGFVLVPKNHPQQWVYHKKVSSRYRTHLLLKHKTRPEECELGEVPVKKGCVFESL